MQSYVSKNYEMWDGLCSLYTLGQKFSDFFLHISNLQINLFGFLQKFGILWCYQLCAIYTFLIISASIRYASVGIKDEPECEGAMLMH